MGGTRFVHVFSPCPVVFGHRTFFFLFFLTAEMQTVLAMAVWRGVCRGPAALCRAGSAPRGSGGEACGAGWGGACLATLLLANPGSG